MYKKYKYFEFFSLIKLFKKIIMISFSACQNFTFMPHFDLLLLLIMCLYQQNKKYIIKLYKNKTIMLMKLKVFAMIKPSYLLILCQLNEQLSLN